MKQFKLTWYQRYYKLLAAFKLKKLTKYDKLGNYIGNRLEYHHVRPVSIYETSNNL